jgi:hypothetical protein
LLLNFSVHKAVQRSRMIRINLPIVTALVDQAAEA